MRQLCHGFNNLCSGWRPRLDTSRGEGMVFGTPFHAWVQKPVLPGFAGSELSQVIYVRRALFQFIEVQYTDCHPVATSKTSAHYAVSCHHLTPSPFVSASSAPCQLTAQETRHACRRRRSECIDKHETSIIYGGVPVRQHKLLCQPAPHRRPPISELSS
jgi:hypothetical protein